MTTPFLATKLYLPRLRPDIVNRPHLLVRLHEGLHRKLTLISAPAGFGKTTLVSEWVEAIDQPAAWLSLDEEDSDLARFLAYLLAAIQTIAATIGERALGMLQSSQPPPAESILTALINEITTLPNDFVLVLDDYHLIDAKPVDNALTFLLERLPPQMHLVIATREDPHLPLTRLRARGQLTELRATDLRFTPSEAAEFLNQMTGQSLSAADSARLSDRTEGWIVGLQLAALSMQGHQDIPRFIRTFAGDHRYIVDYLVEEVLQRQPEPVRSFLLQTAILDRLHGSLCDAVTGKEDGNARLEALERGNLFVVPLDDSRHWYRYHYLFAELLRARLLAEQPNQVATLHRRASEWHEQHGSVANAIRHALAAGDLERVADLLEMAWLIMEASFQSAAWFAWVRTVPGDLVRSRPVLSVWYAYALLNYGDLDAAEARLKDAERWLEPMIDADVRSDTSHSSDRMVVKDDAQFQSLPATIAIARAYRAQALGDLSAAVIHASTVLSLVPAENDPRHVQATALLGLAYWADGNLETANQTFADYASTLRSAGDLAHAISPTFVLAEIRMAQGNVHAAGAALDQLLQLVLNKSEPLPPDTAELYRGLSEVHCEWGDLQTAEQHLRRSKELSNQSTLLDCQRRLCLAEARLKLAQGNLTDALDLLDEADNQYIRTPLPDVCPTGALRARIWIIQGKLDSALAWARKRRLTADDDLTYLSEFEHIILASLLLARCKVDQVNNAVYEAMRLLKRLLQAAEAGGRTGHMIKILVLQALAHQAQGNLDPALIPLERALTLAEPEGFVRVFVDEGQPMANLLSLASASGIMPGYARNLLAHFGAAPLKNTGEFPSLVETFTRRERSVLHLLAAGRSNPEIAADLIISVTTVKTHVKHIYEKLQVTSRFEAIARARELDLP
jgi:LuxR family maltose regulon positive regulatory protein